MEQFWSICELEGFSSAEKLFLQFYFDLRHRLLCGAHVLLWAFYVPCAGVEPWMDEHLRSSQSLSGLSPEEAAQEAASLQWQALWQVDHPPTDFREQGGRVRVMEGVAAHQHGVQHDPQAPGIRLLPWVTAPAAQDLWADVCWAAMGVRHRVILTGQYTTVLQTLQLQMSPKQGWTADVCEHAGLDNKDTF